MLVLGTSVLADDTIHHILSVTVAGDARPQTEIALKTDGDGNLQSMLMSHTDEPVRLKQLRKGFVMNRQKGIETVRLTSDKDFNPKSGGTLVLRYLKHFSFNPFKDHEYGEFRMYVVKEGGEWMLRDEHHQNFTELRLTAQSDGIKEVLPINVTVAPKLQELIDQSVSPAPDAVSAENSSRLQLQKAPEVQAAVPVTSSYRASQSSSSSAR